MDNFEVEFLKTRWILPGEEFILSQNVKMRAKLCEGLNPCRHWQYIEG